jgi:tRNA(Ile)-lysidine synthase TilS/MesJ
VDDSCLEIGNLQEDYNSILQQRQERFSKLKELCDKFKFELDVINLEQVMKIPKFNDLLNCDKENITLHAENQHGVDELIQETIEKLTLSDEFELMKDYQQIYNTIQKIGSFNTDFNIIMTRNLIFYYAIKNNFTKIVFANSAQALVNNIFGSIVKGRGFAIREEIGYVDNHYLHGKITILRPMRDFLEREVLLFNLIYGVDLIFSSKDKLDLQKLNTRSNLPYGGNTISLIDSFFSKQQVNDII